MDGIGPNDIKVNELKERIINEKTTEIILALPATMEGDTTNFYIYRKLQEVKVNITLISRGIGVGNQLEYIDELTLGKSLLDRSIYKTNISN
jgi:recombination protein RecR